MISSPVLDLLIRLKNANKSGKKSVLAPFSKFKEEVCNLLQKAKYIQSFNVVKDGNKSDLQIQLAYEENREPKINSVNIFSRPGRRIYMRADGLPWGQTPHSLVIISTPSGLRSQKQAHKENLGGEIIAEVF
jgi:small subunit ribosomal protein S8